MKSDNPELAYIEKYQDDKDFQKNYGEFYNSDTAWYSGINAGWLLHQQYLLENDISISNAIGKLVLLYEERDDNLVRHKVINLVDQMEANCEKYRS